MQILTRKVESGLYVIINVENQKDEQMNDQLNVSIVKAEGSSGDFTDFVSCIHEQVIALINESAP